MNLGNIKALMGATVLVRLGVGAQQSPSGLIVVPPSAQHYEPYGDVVKVGPEAQYVHEGDRVLVDLYGGILIEEATHERYVLYKEDEIQGIVES